MKSFKQIKELFTDPKNFRPVKISQIWITHYIMLAHTLVFAFVFFLIFNMKIIDTSTIKESSYMPILFISLGQILFAFILSFLIRTERIKITSIPKEKIDPTIYKGSIIMISLTFKDVLFMLVGLQGFMSGFMKAPQYISYGLIGLSFGLLVLNTITIKTDVEKLEQR